MKNLARKCLEHWNAAVSVDEGKNTYQPTGVRLVLMTESEYMVERRKFENWSSTIPEDLKMKLAGFKSCDIPARYFLAKLFPRPFLAQPEGSGVQTSLVTVCKSKITPYVLCSYYHGSHSEYFVQGFRISSGLAVGSQGRTGTTCVTTK